MVQQMAMERPKPRIVGVEGDHDPAPGWHQHGVAHRAGEPVEIAHYGEALTVTKGEPTVRPIRKRPQRREVTQPDGRAPARRHPPGVVGPT